ARRCPRTPAMGLAQSPPVAGTAWGRAAFTIAQRTVVVTPGDAARPPCSTSGASTARAAVWTSAAPLGGTGWPLPAEGAAVCTVPRAICPSGKPRVTATRIIAVDPSFPPKLQGFLVKALQKAADPFPPSGP